MRIEIMENGAVANTIVATPEFAEAHYRGAWRIAAEQPQDTALAEPQVCTPAQGLVALYAVKGITEDDLHAAIEAIADPVARYTARIGLSRATEWRRESQTMQQMAQLVGLNESDLDALYDYAATVQV